MWKCYFVLIIRHLKCRTIIHILKNTYHLFISYLSIFVITGACGEVVRRTRWQSLTCCFTTWLTTSASSSPLVSCPLVEAFVTRATAKPSRRIWSLTIALKRECCLNILIYTISSLARHQLGRVEGSSDAIRRLSTVLQPALPLWNTHGCIWLTGEGKGAFRVHSLSHTNTHKSQD